MIFWLLAQILHHPAYLICLDGTGGLRLYDNLIMRKPQTTPVCLLTLPLLISQCYNTVEKSKNAENTVKFA